jgi:hypothetical protein
MGLSFQTDKFSLYKHDIGVAFRTVIMLLMYVSNCDVSTVC